MALPEPVDGAEHVYHLYVVRHERADELAAALDDAGVGARGYYRVPSTASRRWPASPPRRPTLPGTEEAARTGLALPMGTGPAGRGGGRGGGGVRVWVDLTNSPHVLVMRPLIDAMRADGHEVEVTARDFAQTLELCDRLGIEHTAVGRHRGGQLASKGARPGLAQRRAGALGARPRRSTSRWATAPTT